jgi:NitT/TauT family transport system substrate-binding protein
MTSSLIEMEEAAYTANPMTRQIATMGWRFGAVSGARLVGILLLGALMAARPATADTSLRIARPVDLAALALIVAEHDHLIEKQAQARHLGPVTVQWLLPGGNPLDATAAGADIVVATDLAKFVAAWDAGAGTPQEILGLAALARMPYTLVTRNPAIETIRDFTQKDRIAVPAPKVSLPAVMLQMAAAQEWGLTRYDRFDGITVARSDGEAAAALRTAKDGIDTDFARLPYSDEERGDPAVHRVMDSFDIAGPHSVGVVVTTAPFRDDNPQLCAAVIAAIDEAGVFIRQNPGAAAEIYAKAVKSDDLAVEDLTDMLADPDIGFAAAPAGVMNLARFLRQTGRLKHEPESWQELFFPEAHKLPGG